MADIIKIQDKITSMTGSNDLYKDIDGLIDTTELRADKPPLAKCEPENILWKELVLKVDELVTEVNNIKDALSGD